MSYTWYLAEIPTISRYNLIQALKFATHITRIIQTFIEAMPVMWPHPSRYSYTLQRDI